MNSTNKKIKFFVDNFIKKILELNNNKYNLDEKINIINELLNNLIDFCIKKKVFFYVENKIGYNSIVSKFKTHLINYLQKLIDPDNKILTKYLTENVEYDNVSDINSLLFYKFKNDNIKNKVSFREDDEIYNYEDNDGFECNYKLDESNDLINENLLKFENNDDIDIIDNKKLVIYIKILINQNKFLIELIEKLNNMCKIISDPSIKYNINNPFEQND